MTHDEWRNLKQGDLITVNGLLNIFVVKSTGWDDLEEKDYDGECDYIIEVTDIFEHMETPHNGGEIVTAEQSFLFKESISDKLLKIAANKEEPYDYLQGYMDGKKLLYEK